MKIQKKSTKLKHGLLALSHVAAVSAYAGANSKCVFIFHDLPKPEAIRSLRKL